MGENISFMCFGGVGDGDKVDPIAQSLFLNCFWRSFVVDDKMIYEGMSNALGILFNTSKNSCVVVLMPLFSKFLHVGELFLPMWPV